MRLRVISLVLAVGLQIFAIPGATAQDARPGAEKSGVYVRVLRIEVDPADVPEWEDAVRQIAAAARDSDIEACCGWLLYREGVVAYHAVFFSDGLADFDTPASFRHAFAGAAGEAAFLEGVQRLLSTRFEVVGDEVSQMVAGWSTVEGMDPSTHPKARLTRYWVRPGSEDAFAAAMRNYATLLKEVDYRYPVEGFRWQIGAPNVNFVVIFPDVWTGFFGGNDIGAVVRRSGRGTDYAAVQERIAETVFRIRHHDLDYAAALSY